MRSSAVLFCLHTAELAAVLQTWWSSSVLHARGQELLCSILRLLTSNNRIATLQAWVLKYNEEVGERKEAYGAAAAALAQVLSHLQADRDSAQGQAH